MRLQLEGLGPEPQDKIWHFHEAPRDMRIRNSRYLPQLIERLSETAEKKAQEVDEHANDAEELARTISKIADASRGKAALPPKGGK